MHSILGWASFCMNYCINAAWHGGDQSVALLRCNEAQDALIAAFRSSALLSLVSLIFLLTKTVDFRKHSGPTPADDMAAQIITDCGNFTLDFKQHGFCVSPLFLQTLGP